MMTLAYITAAIATLAIIVAIILIKEHKRNGQ